ncbi:uroporphyrinogen decarboxylase family protein [Chloroflexota bacterium]
MTKQPAMTSKERLLNAINLQPVDQTPLYFRFWSLGGAVDNIPFNWRDEVERVEHTLALGLDDTITLQPPLGYVEEYRPEALPGVTSTTERLPPAAGESDQRLKKVYQTPAGPLQTVITLTEDWPYGDEIMLFDDHNIPRLKEPLIKTAEDLPKLKYLLGQPSAEQIAAFRQHAQEFRGHAERLGVLLDGGWIALGDAAVWLCGMEGILYGQMDAPEFLADLLDIIAAWELARVQLLLAEGVDMIVHMAWYETTDFWTPANYRRLLKPRLQKEIDRVHSAGKKYRYIITKAWQPYIPDFLAMGIDCLTGVDPVQDTLDLAEVKQQVGGQICLMGGLNSAVMLSQWDDDQISAAVKQAINVMAPGGGFIGYPVDAIFDAQSWRKVEHLIEQWHKRTNSL